MRSDLADVRFNKEKLRKLQFGTFMSSSRFEMFGWAWVKYSLQEVKVNEPTKWLFTSWFINCKMFSIAPTNSPANVNRFTVSIYPSAPVEL